MFLIEIILPGLYLGLLLFKTIHAWRYVASYPIPAGEIDIALATIVQPILSGDARLETVLEDNLRVLAKASFLWLIDDDDIVAQRICSEIRARNPQCIIECLSLPPAAYGANPKLHKLEICRHYLRTPLMVVLDDDTRLPELSLKALIEALREYDLSTGLPCYLHDGRLASRLLAQFVNNQAALTYLSLVHFTSPVTINGMGYALRADRLDSIGGFAPLMRHLTDDLALACRIREAGGLIRQTPYPQFIQTSVRNLCHYNELMHRWFLFALLLLRRQSTDMQAIIFLLHGLPPLLLWAMLCTIARYPSYASAALVGLVIFLRALCLIAIQRRTTGASRHSLFLSIIAELLQPLHFIHALLVRRITWRKRRYRVFDNDNFVPE